MKFTCTKENLAYSLGLVGGVAQKHANLPILLNILFQARESKVELVATNLEIAVKTSFRAKIDKEGSFTIPAKTLLDYVNLLSDEQITIELKDAENEVLIFCGSSSTKIKGSSAEDYPVIPEIEEIHGYSIAVESFKKALSQTSVATAKNEIRPELSGVYFDFFSDRYSGLTMAATDSYRLAEKKNFYCSRRRQN